MILLDTCVLLWLVSGSAELSEAARRSISDHAGGLCVSAITAWEIGIKSRKRHLELPLPLWEWFERACARHGVRCLPVEGRQAAISTLLPPVHADPADRLIIAAAQAHSVSIITPDAHIAQYPDLKVIW